MGTNSLSIEKLDNENNKELYKLNNFSPEKENHSPLLKTVNVVNFPVNTKYISGRSNYKFISHPLGKSSSRNVAGVLYNSSQHMQNTHKCAHKDIKLTSKHVKRPLSVPVPGYYARLGSTSYVNSSYISDYRPNTEAFSTSPTSHVDSAITPPPRGYKTRSKMKEFKKDSIITRPKTVATIMLHRDVRPNLPKNRSKTAISYSIKQNATIHNTEQESHKLYKYINDIPLRSSLYEQFTMPHELISESKHFLNENLVLKTDINETGHKSFMRNIRRMLSIIDKIHTARLLYEWIQRDESRNNDSNRESNTIQFLFAKDNYCHDVYKMDTTKHTEKPKYTNKTKRIRPSSLAPLTPWLLEGREVCGVKSDNCSVYTPCDASYVNSLPQVPPPSNAHGDLFFKRIVSKTKK